MYKFNDDCECESRLLNFLCEDQISESILNERANMQIQSLYRQMKLQKAFEECPTLEKGFRDSQLYTNSRLLNNIAMQIQATGTDYPKSFQALTNDLNTNTLLTAIQLRRVHMNTDPLAGYDGQPQ